jgi:hypothetical protein
LLSVPCNALIVIAYTRFYSLRSPTNFLTGNLCACNLLSGVFGALAILVNYLDLTLHYKYPCLVSLYLLVSLLLCSFASIVLISVERLIAVVFSLEFFRWVTDGSVRWWVGCVWGGVLLLQGLPLLGLNKWSPGVACRTNNVYPAAYFQLTFSIPIVGSAVGVVVMNAVIGAAARKQLRKIRAEPQQTLRIPNS